MKNQAFFERVIEYQIMGNHSLGEALEMAKIDFDGEITASYPLEYVTRKLREYHWVKYRNQLAKALTENRSTILSQIKK